MNNSFVLDNKDNQNLTSKEKVKFAILGNRLGLSSNNAKYLFDSFHKETASIFSLDDSEVMSDIDFSGREFDFVFTINKKNIPENKI